MLEAHSHRKDASTLVQLGGEENHGMGEQELATEARRRIAAPTQVELRGKTVLELNEDTSRFWVKKARRKHPK